MSVLKEILQELKEVKASQLCTEDRLGRVENNITEIKASVKRIEENEPQEALSLLSIMNRKMDNVEKEWTEGI
jgi:hypothetical protein